MHIHIVSIAGAMTAPLAIALQRQGHYVTGSDQTKIYPPFSQQLKRAGISINKISINSDIDLAIIGSSYTSFKNTRQEFEEIKSHKIPYISATEYISKYLIKENSVLVAGSYGKTTISAGISYLLQRANFNPSFFFGGKGLNHQVSLYFSDSKWSVVEADESINGLDTKAKFIYYPVKYLILTSALWEHKDCYQNEGQNFRAFKALIKKIPKSGLLIYNFKDPSILPLLPFAKCQCIPYKNCKLKNKLIGSFNQQNLGAIESFAEYLKIPPKIIALTLNSFKGVKRRLELKAEVNNIKFIDDYAQSGARIKAVLQALKNAYPQSHLKVFYEIHASFLQYQSNLKELSGVFNLAHETVIYRLKFNITQNKDNRLVAKDYLKIIPKSIYIPLAPDLIRHYQKSLKPGDILIHFSSGGADGLKTFKKIINLFKNL